MAEKTVTLELPASLYSKLESLAQKEQIDVPEMLSRWARQAREGGEAEENSNHIARRLRIAQALRGVWSEEDEKAFRKMRDELWSQWNASRSA